MRRKVVYYEEGGHLRRGDGGLVGGHDDPDLMRRDGLWLTNAGRVVKPAFGEYAAPDMFGDIPLLEKREVEIGVRMEEFDKRWKAAVREWKRRASRKEKGGAG